MSGPSIDLEKPNIIGGLDRLVTNFAISAIAVIPTFFTCIFMPWRLVPLLRQEPPDGREGMLLAPGAFFPLCLMVSFTLAALLSTPEIASNNGSFIGPNLALSVLSAASEGNVWKLIATIMPIYGTAVCIGLVGVLLKPWAHKGWNLRVSLRAAFYLTTVLISWLILTTAVIELVRAKTANNNIYSELLPFIIVPTGATIIWIYFWFFHSNGALSRLRSGILSVAMFGLMFATIIVIDLLMRLQI